MPYYFRSFFSTFLICENVAKKANFNSSTLASFLSFEKAVKSGKKVKANNHHAFDFLPLQN